ncbi:MAG: type II toxin-antitoxin system HicA family toxin [Candidatus Binatia bacterium]
MTSLPRVSGRQCVRILERAGFIVQRQHGSHIVLRR